MLVKLILTGWDLSCKMRGKVSNCFEILDGLWWEMIAESLEENKYGLMGNGYDKYTTSLEQWLFFLY